VRRAFGALANAELVQVNEESVTIAVHEASKRLPEVFSTISASGGVIRETILSQASLETLFIKLTGKELRE
jgi:hypothetical protein